MVSVVRESLPNDAAYLLFASMRIQQSDKGGLGEIARHLLQAGRHCRVNIRSIDQCSADCIGQFAKKLCRGHGVYFS